VNYVGAGTIEFIADASEGLKGDRIWFMEMNTRLQVEHPVTEEITGQDLVEWQLRVASGEKLPLKQEELKINGWAMEARLYAEDPSTGFLPSIGRLEVFKLPDFVRVDSGFQGTDDVSPNYDPMLAKLIAHGETREQAMSELRDACADTRVWPVRTNAGFLVRCLEDERFSTGEVDTGLIASRGEPLTSQPKPDTDVSAAAAGAAIWHSRDHFLPEAKRGSVESPWNKITGFRLNAPPNKAVMLRHHGAESKAEWGKSFGDARGFVPRQDRLIVVHKRGEAYEFTLDTGERNADEATASGGAILSPMPGKIVSVAAKAGAKLKKGDPILVLEAMKVEHTLPAPFYRKLADLNAKAGAQVSEGVLLAKLEKD
ncbi:MAG: methylcrotonoyl-CoA carboxylase, partial [Hyphomonadaceae bacterium]|nr:methylcrotonoyl-CoA carboxylase [Hyphomonadaceae bacterium]